MTSPVIDPVPRPDSPNVHWPLPTTTTTTAAPTTTTTLPLPPQPQQGSSDSILIKRMGKLEQYIADLVEENQALEKRLDKEQTVEFIDSQEIDRKINESVKEVVISSVKHAMRAPLCARFKDLPTSDLKEIMLQRILEENYDKGHVDHRVAYEALQDFIRHDECEDFDVDKAQEETKKKSKQDSLKPPPGSPPLPLPPPPPPSGASGASGTTGASDSAQASSSTTFVLIHSLGRSVNKHRGPNGDEVGRDHIPTVNLRQSWWKPLTEDRPSTPEPAWTIPSSDLPVPTNNWASALKTIYVPPPKNSLLAQTGDIATFMDWYYKRQGISELTPKDLKGPAFEIVKVFHHDVIHLQFQMEECHKPLTNQIDDAILKYNVSKPLPLGGEPGHVGRPALSILKMKATYYPDEGLEQLVPDQFWIEEECKYDIAAMYVFSMYGYNYMKKIVLHRADLKEYVIAERDFKYMYPSDFEDMYLLNLQGHLNHLSPKDKKILTTAVNLWTRNLVIRQRVKDFQLGIESYQTQLNLTKPHEVGPLGFEFKA
ncbi:hypothetical protein Tco_1351229 [Tanacetum coccineum]